MPNYIDDIDFTTSNYITVYAPDGTYISRHRLEDEARESAFQHAKDNNELLGEGYHLYEIRRPTTRMSVRLLDGGVGNKPINPPVDVDPPLPPAGVFLNNQTQTQFQVNWSSNSEPDIQDYRVYYSSTSSISGYSLWATTTGTSATIVGLSPDTQYWVYVTARDNSLNESSASSVVTITTDSDVIPPITGIFVDGTNGNDSWDGTSAVFTGGTTGPKATVSAGISACSAGDSLYLVNNQSYGFATYDLDWNAGAGSTQAAELAGCYVSDGVAYRWTEASGEPKPVCNFRMRTTNDYFTIHGLQFSTASYTLQANSVWNFTLSYIDSTRSGTDTQAGVFYFFNGRNGQRWINILNSTFTWVFPGIDWAQGTDYVKIDVGYKYGEIAYNIFTRAPHDTLGLLGDNFRVHHNTFDNTDGGNFGYRACSFNVERDLPDSTPPNVQDGGEPYGENLIEHNTFISSTAPQSSGHASASENTAPIIKLQNKRSIYRFNTFQSNITTTNADVLQIQTCCSDINSSHLAPLVADQRFYNNTVIANNFLRWSRVRTTQTDGSSASAENTRTENHDNHIFNNHFEGEPVGTGEALWEFQQIAPAYRINGHPLSQNKVEYNSYSSSRTSAFVEDASNGQQALSTAESNHPTYIRNNTVNSSGGAGLGRDLTVTVGSGTGTVLTVEDAGVFMPTITDNVNGEVYSGDVITVAGQTATVTARNLVANTLTLDTTVTWTAGQAVNLNGYATGYTGIPPVGSSSGFTGVTSAVDATGSGTRYDIGGGNNYGTELSDVPWQSLQPGDAVNIYYRAAPYRSKILLSERGTATNPIVVNGVTDANGNRPILDAQDAVSVNPSEWDSDWRYSMILINRQNVSGTYGVIAEYCTIQNLHIRNVLTSNNFTHSGAPEPYPSGASAVMSRGAKHIVFQGNIIENTEGNGLFVSGDGPEFSSESWTVRGNKFVGNAEGDRHHQVYFQAMNEPGVTKNIIEGNVFDDPRTPVTSVAQFKTRATGLVIRYNWFTSAHRTIDIVEAQDDVEARLFTVMTPQQIIDEYRTSYIYGNAFVIDIDDSAVPGQLLHVGMDTLEDGNNGLFQNVGSAQGQDAQRGIDGGATYFFNNTVYINTFFPGIYRNSLFDLDSNNESTGTYSPGKLVAINNVFEFDGGSTTRYSAGERTGDINWDGANIVNYSEIHNGVLYESDPYANAENTGDDPNIDITVNGNIISGTASLTDPTNPTLLSKDLTLSAGSAAIGQAASLPAALSAYPVNKSPASPMFGGTVARTSTNDLGAYETVGTVESSVYDNFSGATQPLDAAKWTTYNDPGTGSIVVQQNGGRYEGTIPTGDASATTWFNADEGRLDYVTLTGDFEFIARNIGLDSGATNDDYQFCGVAAWNSATEYEFAVAGQRGPTANTIEYKITSGGSSTQNDIGANAIPTGKADIRIVRSGTDVDFYYQQPGTSPDSWTLLPHDTLGAARINFGTGPVRVGLVTYGFLFVAQFVGTCDQVEIN